MNCPWCGNSQTIVVDSRPTEYLVRRRRQCVECGGRFTTLEKIVKRRKKDESNG